MTSQTPFLTREGKEEEETDETKGKISNVFHYCVPVWVSSVGVVGTVGRVLVVGVGLGVGVRLGQGGRPTQQQSADADLLEKDNENRLNPVVVHKTSPVNKVFRKDSSVNPGITS